jgi:hypothetical protein
MCQISVMADFNANVSEKLPKSAVVQFIVPVWISLPCIFTEYLV